MGLRMGAPVSLEVVSHRRSGLGRFETVVVRVVPERSLRSLTFGVDVFRRREHMILGQATHSLADLRAGVPREATVVVALSSRTWSRSRVRAYATLMR
jgi:hypothetical protein